MNVTNSSIHSVGIECWEEGSQGVHTGGWMNVATSSVHSVSRDEGERSVTHVKRIGGEPKLITSLGRPRLRLRLASLHHRTKCTHTATKWVAPIGVCHRLPHLSTNTSPSCAPLLSACPFSLVLSCQTLKNHRGERGREGEGEIWTAVIVGGV